MSHKRIQLTDPLHQYLLEHSLRESDILRELRELTLTMPESNMQIAPEQGQFLALLIQLTGARRTLEVGVFTGYSALAVAQALPDDGEVVACDVNASFTSIAQGFWQRAGVAHKVTLKLAPATETLQNLVDNGETGQYDFAFIDADKPNYVTYFEYCFELVRPGGLIAVDNVLWGGDVLDANSRDESTMAIRHFNALVAQDNRVELCMLPLADGLTLARKKSG